MNTNTNPPMGGDVPCPPLAKRKTWLLAGGVPISVAIAIQTDLSPLAVVLLAIVGLIALAIIADRANSLEIKHGQTEIKYRGRRSTAIQVSSPKVSEPPLDGGS